MERLFLMDIISDLWLMIKVIFFIAGTVWFPANRIDPPLHQAVKEGDEERVLELLLDGADRTQKNHDGLTPLQVASKSSWNSRMIKYLVFSGRNMRGECFQRFHRKFQYFNITKYLKEILIRYPHIDLRDFAGYTPLQLVLSFIPHRTGVVLELLRGGCDPRVLDPYGNNCLHLLAVWGSREPYFDRLQLIVTFLDRGVDINAGNALNNDTPLHITIKKSSGFTNALLENGANITLLNKDNLSPFDLVFKRNNRVLLRRLVRYVALAERTTPNSTKTMTQKIKTNPELNTIYENLTNELDFLGSKKIKPSHKDTYLDLLCGGKAKLIKILHKEGSRRLLWNLPFTTYRQMMIGMVHRAAGAKLARDLAFEVSNELLGDKLPYLCIRRISSYFDVTDIRRLKRLKRELFE